MIFPKQQKGITRITVTPEQKNQTNTLQNTNHIRQANQYFHNRLTPTISPIKG